MSAAAIFTVGLGYLLGGIPASYWMVRWQQGGDVRLLGSGNPGATNVLRVSGLGAAVPVLMIDLGKGILAVAIARWLDLPPGVQGAAGAAAVMGHIWPLWLKFQGGKGVATAGGVFLALEPVAFAIALGGFLVVVAVTRIASLGSVAAAVIAPLATWKLSLDGGSALIAWSMLIAGLVVGRHHSNIARLRRGAEPRLGRRSE